MSASLIIFVHCALHGASSSSAAENRDYTDTASFKSESGLIPLLKERNNPKRLEDYFSTACLSLPSDEEQQTCAQVQLFGLNLTQEINTPISKQQIAATSFVGFLSFLVAEETRKTTIRFIFQTWLSDCPKTLAAVELFYLASSMTLTILGAYKAAEQYNSHAVQKTVNEIKDPLTRLAYQGSAHLTQHERELIACAPELLARYKVAQKIVDLIGQPQESKES